MMEKDLTEIGKDARLAARQLLLFSNEKKDQFLETLALSLWSEREKILEANSADVLKAREKMFSEALIDRLLLTEKRLQGMMADIRQLIELPDPVGKVLEEKTLSNGIRAKRQRVPLGVLAVIYEARPNVTVDITALALKSGNAVLLRGGKETRLTNLTLVEVIHQVLVKFELPTTAVQFIDDPDRRYVNQLVKMDNYVDLLIPRGGNRLQEFCKQEATMPVMTGGIGICHLFVDASADLVRVVDVVENAKVQRPSVCNALDTLLVHQNVANTILPMLYERLKRYPVEMKLDEYSAAVLGIQPELGLVAAVEGDYDQEWLALILGIKVVEDVDDAIHHIWQHSTFHSDGILSETKENINKFVRSVDSAAVYVNASTRFTDGAQLGLGGEVAVSTQKLHARGPVGLEALTSYKWILEGDYTVRE